MSRLDGRVVTPVDSRPVDWNTCLPPLQNRISGTCRPPCLACKRQSRRQGLRSLEVLDFFRILLLCILHMHIIIFHVWTPFAIYFGLGSGLGLLLSVSNWGLFGTPCCSGPDLEVRTLSPISPRLGYGFCSRFELHSQPMFRP